MSNEVKEIKLSVVDHAIDRALLTLAPKTLCKRINARQKAIHELSYEGARSSRLRSRARQYSESSSEDPQTQRERYQMIWEARSLEKNFPFVSRILGAIEDYVLGDFKVLSEVSNLRDREVINNYWNNWQLIADYTGRDNFHDLSRLVLRSTVRDGDILGYIHTGEVIPMGTETLPLTPQTAVQIQLIEGDRVGSPDLAGTTVTDGYIDGVLINQFSGEPYAYRVYERSLLNGTYTNPVDLQANAVLHIRHLKRADSYRGVTEFAPALPTMRDIMEVIENERIAVKWASSNAGVIKKVSGHSDEATTYPDDNVDGAAANGPRLTENWKPGTINYLYPDEDFQAFEYNRTSPAFQGLLDLLYRDCCFAVDMPYGFLVQPNGNGTAARLESAQAKRTIKRWQRVMRDRWIMPIWIRVIQHAIATGQIRVTMQTVAELTKVKINWPAWPTADVGRESAANVNEFQAGLKSASSVFAERGEDFDVELRQIALEKQRIQEVNGSGAHLLKMGPGALQAMMQLVQSAGTSISVEQAAVVLKEVYGLPEKSVQAFLAAPKLPAPTTTQS